MCRTGLPPVSQDKQLIVVPAHLASTSQPDGSSGTWSYLHDTPSRKTTLMASKATIKGSENSS